MVFYVMLLYLYGTQLLNDVLALRRRLENAVISAQLL